MTVHIPHWDPTDLETGFFWLREHVYEGFKVDFLVEEEGLGRKVLWLKSWEPWDPDQPSERDEPTWDSIKGERMPRHDSS